MSNYGQEENREENHRYEEEGKESAITAAMAEKSQNFDPKYDDYDFPTTSPEARSGHPGHTTEEQDAKIFQLRAMLEQEGYTERLDTLTLLRFLRARKFNVEAAKAMYVLTRSYKKMEY